MNAPVRPPSPENASPARIFQAILATDFRAFVDYVFGLLRPGIPFKPNWHIDAMAHKAAQVASGEVKRLIITVQREGNFVHLGSEPVHLSKLADAVKAQAGGRTQVYIQADRSASYGRVIEVMDMLKSAGINDVGLVTSPPDAK